MLDENEAETRQQVGCDVFRQSFTRRTPVVEGFMHTNGEQAQCGDKKGRRVGIQYVLCSDKRNTETADGRTHKKPDVGRRLHERVGSDEPHLGHNERNRRGQGRPEDRGEDCGCKHEEVEPVESQGPHGIEQRDQENHQSSEKIHPDHDWFLSNTIQIYTNQRPQQQGR